jgi:hypothetical protein
MHEFTAELVAFGASDCLLLRLAGIDASVNCGAFSATKFFSSYSPKSSYEPASWRAEPTTRRGETLG